MKRNQKYENQFLSLLASVRQLISETVFYVGIFFSFLFIHVRHVNRQWRNKSKSNTQKSKRGAIQTADALICIYSREQKCFHSWHFELCKSIISKRMRQIKNTFFSNNIYLILNKLPFITKTKTNQQNIQTKKTKTKRMCTILHLQWKKLNIIPNQYFVHKALLAITLFILFGILSTNFSMVSFGIRFHSSSTRFQRSSRLDGIDWYCPSRLFTIDHRFSIGLRSGLWAGHSISIKSWFCNHSPTILAVCFGSPSCWKMISFTGYAHLSRKLGR